MSSPAKSLTFMKHFTNVMNYCKNDTTNPDIPLHLSVAYIEGYIRGMDQAYDEWLQDQKEGRDMNKDSLITEQFNGAFKDSGMAIYPTKFATAQDPDESAVPVKADA